MLLIERGHDYSSYWDVLFNQILEFTLFTEIVILQIKPTQFNKHMFATFVEHSKESKFLYDILLSLFLDCSQKDYIF